MPLDAVVIMNDVGREAGRVETGESLWVFMVYGSV